MTLLIDAWVRCSLVVLAGLAASTLPGRRSAAQRHRVLAVAILAAAAVVPLGLVLPAWELDLYATRAGGASAAPAAAVVGPVAVLGRTDTLSTLLLPFVPVIWVAGAAMWLAVLVAGLVRLRSLAARARPVRDGRCRRLAAEIAAQFGLECPPTLLHSDEPALLATWGVLRPHVMLPSDAPDWSDERVRVVLCHELAHVRRNDWAVQLAAEALRAVYWFNPLLWLACARLRRESERACDDVVLSTGVSPRAYASHLIDLARTCRRPRPTLISTMPMARRSNLRGRIVAMLNPGLNRANVSRRAAALTVFGLMAVTLPAAALRAPQDSPRPLTGAVYDASGAALPQVELTLEDAQHAKLQVITDAAGHFEFPPVPPGDYVLDAAVPGFRRLRYELSLQRARDWNQAITLQVGEVRETISVRASRAAAPASPRSDAAAPVKVGGNVRPPKKIKDVAPEYPASMQEAGLEGKVPLEAVISRDGSVSSLRVLSAKVHPDLAMAAINAVRQWRFEPTLLNGVPVDVTMTVTIDFRLSD